MARSIHVRLDDSAAAALRVVRGDSGSDSEAVRVALREAAARRRARSSLVAEVGRLAGDYVDREETRIVREQLAELAPDPVD
jgi:Arc/MetJ-type ribon-helix-helix transcriptional regulator